MHTYARTEAYTHTSEVTCEPLSHQQRAEHANSRNHGACTQQLLKGKRPANTACTGAKGMQTRHFSRRNLESCVHTARWKQNYSSVLSKICPLFRDLQGLALKICPQGVQGREVAGARRMGAAARMLSHSSSKIAGWRRRCCTLRGCLALRLGNAGLFYAALPLAVLSCFAFMCLPPLLLPSPSRPCWMHTARNTDRDRIRDSESTETVHANAHMCVTLNRHRSLVLSRTHAWVYTDEATCPQRDLQCYFQPWSK